MLHGLYGSTHRPEKIMFLMKSKTFVFAVVAFTAAAAPAAMAATCSVKDKAPSNVRILAQATDQSSWSEYQNLQDVPDVMLGGGMTASVVQQKKIRSVTIVKPGQSFWTYTRYCFADDGQLFGVGFEVRTNLGWGYRREGNAVQGGFSAQSHEFFRTKDGKAIPRPEGVADAPLGLQPALYFKVSELPFAALLKTAAGTRGKHGAALTLAKAGN